MLNNRQTDGQSITNPVKGQYANTERAKICNKQKNNQI